MSLLHRQSLRFLLPISAVLPMFFVFGCVATSSYYTGRTLDEGKATLGIAADDVFLKSTDASVTITGKAPFAPSFGVGYGLPWRFEGGLRYYPPQFLEATLRYQVNPREFDLLDCSVNFHAAHLFLGYSYLKYGVSISKNIEGFEPFVHYYGYRFVGATEGDFTNKYVSLAAKTFISNTRSFGIGIPIPQAKLFPEVDYQYYSTDTKIGLWHFGVGIRVDIE